MTNPRGLLPHEEARRALDARNREFEARFAAHDAQGLVAAYFVGDQEQPMASPPGGVPPVRGRAALAEMFQAQFAAIRSIRLESLQVEVGGDIAFELGRAHLELNGSGSALGRYTVLWRKSDDGWRAKTDFFATDGWAD